VEESLATFETANAPVEHNAFLYYDEAVRVNTTIFDKTDPGPTYYSTRLNGSTDEQYGVSKSLSVMPGDTVRAEVYVKYADPAQSDDWDQTLKDLLTSIANNTAPPGTFIDGGAPGSIGGQAFPLAGFLNKSHEADAVPKAFLNWLLFDRDYKFLDGGYIQITEAAREDGRQTRPHELLQKEIIIGQAGFVYLYLSNDNVALGGSSVDVFFDDFKVEHVKGAIVQTDDYYPFGLTYNSYSRESSMPNRYLFNKGSEFQTDLSINLYFTPFRLYDPAIGRFTQIDPMADFFTGINPYSFAFDNPILFGDPDGLGPIDWLKRLFRGHVGDGASRQARRSQRYNHATGVTRGPRSKGSQNHNNSSSTPTSQPQVLIALGSGPTRQEDEKPEPPPDKRDDPNPPKIDIDRVLTGNPVTYTEVVKFKGGKDEIENQYTAGGQLKALVDILKAHPEISAFIHGNVGDGELPGTKFLLNDKLVPAEKLMNARAKAIYNFLIERGVDPKQLKYGTGQVNGDSDGYNVTFDLNLKKN
jgi:RHS repeat-associated protein